jgi:hypothetical protein
MQSQVDIAVGELEPGYRALVEPSETWNQGDGPYRTLAIEPVAAEYFPGGGRLGVFTGCVALGTVMLAIGGGALAFVLALASNAIVVMLGFLAFGGMVAAGIGLWAFAVREVQRTRSAARRRQGVFLVPDGLFISEEQRCSLLPWSCVEDATAFSATDESTDYVLVAYREEGGEGQEERTLRVRVPWRKGKLLRRIRRRLSVSGRRARRRR